MTADAPEMTAWDDAVLAARLLAVDPAHLHGVIVRAKAGPVREAWLDLMRRFLPSDAPFGKLPLNASDDSLFGGIDIANTLASGKLTHAQGFLARHAGGVIVLPLAERLDKGLAARLSAVLDHDPMRVSLIALDESEPDEPPPPSCLTERLALFVDLTAIGPRDINPPSMSPEAIDAAKSQLPAIAISDAQIAYLCKACLDLGIFSLRAPILAVHTARAAAALFGRPAVEKDDLLIAARLVLGPRATLAPMPENEAPSPAETEPGEGDDQRDKNNESDGDGANDGPMADVILAAAQAALPPRLFSKIEPKPQRRMSQAQGGRGAPKQLGSMRGRPIGACPARGKSGERLSVIDTLRAAAPWQRLRRNDIGSAAQSHDSALKIRKQDFRVRRFRSATPITTIFSIDASGSTALQRLAEVKGAIELLMADCYIRRDQVALIVFRGRAAQILLPPTRSLTRAKRELAALAGGGGTPLASGLSAAATLAMRVKHAGGAAVVVIMTDGRANVGLDGEGGRDRAQADATAMARNLRRLEIATLLVDASPRPQAQAAKLAQELGAQYLPLPRADAKAISAAARAVASS